MDINDWLNRFKSNWEDKNMDNILSLFSEDVTYYETPFNKLSSINEIKKEWSTILDQDEIKLNYSVFSKDDNKYTVQWDLKYSKNAKQFHFAGVYLITLNRMGQCIEFKHYCEKDSS